MNVLLSLKFTLGSWSRLNLIHDLIIAVVNFLIHIDPVLI